MHKYANKNKKNKAAVKQYRSITDVVDVTVVSPFTGLPEGNNLYILIHMCGYFWLSVKNISTCAVKNVEAQFPHCFYFLLLYS